MSVQAVTWALDQVTAANAKSLLLVLATYADRKTGICWPSLPELARETCLSISTVQRRFQDLQQEGIVYRVNLHKRKKKGQSDAWRTILLFTDDARDLARSLGWQGSSPDDQEHGCDGPVVAFEPRGQIDLVVKKPRGQNRQNHKVNCDLQNPLRDPSEESLKSPFSSTDEIDCQFETFKTKWPFGVQETFKRAEPAFRHLCQADRVLAIRWVPAFLEERKRRGWGPGRARTYLRNKAWEPLEAAAKTRANGGKILIREGAPAFDAWRDDHHAKEGRRPMFVCNQIDPHTGEKVRGILRDTEWPPGRRPANRVDCDHQRGAE